jgi:hypothetical protein
MIVMNIAATYTTLTATFWLTRLVISAQCDNDRFSSVPRLTPAPGGDSGSGVAGDLGGESPGNQVSWSR